MLPHPLHVGQNVLPRCPGFLWSVGFDRLSVTRGVSVSGLRHNPETWGLSRVDALLLGVSVTTVPQRSRWYPGSSGVLRSERSLLLPRRPVLRFAVWTLPEQLGVLESLVPDYFLISSILFNCFVMTVWKQ